MTTSTAPRRKSTDPLFAADLFCGAGGTSEGLLMAANQLKADLTLIAINHWQIAIDTHSINHPYAKHLCTGVARGGRPISDQSRSSAWLILHWAEQLYIDSILIENVPEFQSWGPIGANGRPLKSKRGHLFQQFIGSLRALGYNVEWRVVNCADYGDPTTRKRLFIMARRGSKAIQWPEPTHAQSPASLFADNRKPWRTAREIINWTLPSQSIFERKRNLAEKTLLRIQAGLKKFCGLDVDLKRCLAEDLRPFLVVLRGTGTTASIDDPLQTVTASGNHYGLVEPFIAQWDQQGSSSGVRSIDEPVPTQVTKANTGLVEPFLVPHFGEREGQSPRTHSLDSPMPTVATSVPALIQPYMVTVNHGGDRKAASINDPMPTATSKIGTGICQPFLIAYYGTKNMSETGKPVPTVTTKERFGLVEAEIQQYRLDIKFRMLQPSELARAQGFPDTYKFNGNREAVVKQIGNAVPPNTAKALILEAIA